MRPSTTPRGRGELLDRAHDRRGARGLVGLDLGDDLGVVHVAEVRAVDAVLGQLLGGGGDREVHRGPLASSPRSTSRPWSGISYSRLGALGVVPRHDEVLADLADRVRAHPGLLVGAGAVGDVGVGAVGVELPAVERADQLAAVDVAAVAEVGTEVRAVGVVEVGGALVVAPQHEVAAEVVAGEHVARLELARPRHLEPPERDVEGVAAGVGLLGRDGQRHGPAAVRMDPSAAGASAAGASLGAGSTSVIGAGPFSRVAARARPTRPLAGARRVAGPLEPDPL